MDNRITVIIVDDHPLVLNGFAFILQNQKHIDLKGSFTSAVAAIDYIKCTAVDLVLMDINMPDMNGIDATLAIKKINPGIHIVAISNLNEASVARRMLQSGASGYLLKNVSATELIAAMQKVTDGEQVVSEEMINAVKEKTEEVPFITRREREVLLLLAEGQTTPEIAENLFISKLTVETHRRNLLQKFKVNNSASLIHRATEMKYI
ncbi:response regulator transcription factor [Sphingobacterium oryzagri]|uniref:Response regulator transcription factor n=1 Tax=Sphingobacterium oryzagri TaxID=3025669 RepID=A0ABY7WCX3_9SPHI|nr:response regulator transcription factor [Sphingobacterium sp. KACC 22765]WDF67504.1 response regulator transcription factor [Sphingobacterium sp. KACC 22765]